MPDLSLLLTISRLAAKPGYFTGLHRRLAKRGIVAAVQTHNTPALFGWLVEILSLQGISDAAAFTFMDVHGRASWADVAQALQNQPACPKLRSHWHFHRCDFVRSKDSCAQPAHYPACPLPSLPLRNGALNRMAYGLYLFIRDVCDGDLVGWIDQRLQAVPNPTSTDYPERLGQALITPLRHLFGVSHKVLNMTLADLLIGADPNRSLWMLAGQHMIAVDTLIHNLLHRTGTLAQCGAEHAYGPGCYASQGCASIVRQ